MSLSFLRPILQPLQLIPQCQAETRNCVLLTLPHLLSASGRHSVLIGRLARPLTGKTVATSRTTNKTGRQASLLQVPEGDTVEAGLGVEVFGFLEGLCCPGLSPPLLGHGFPGVVVVPHGGVLIHQVGVLGLPPPPKVLDLHDLQQGIPASHATSAVAIRAGSLTSQHAPREGGHWVVRDLASPLP